MNSEKYIGLDVHQATISVAVLDSSGKLVMESILKTKAATILEFFAGLRGTLSVTFEEGTWAAWLHDLLQPPRSTASLRQKAHFFTREAGGQARFFASAQQPDISWLANTGKQFVG